MTENTIITKDISVDIIRREITNKIIRCDKPVQLTIFVEANWLSFWENHRDFMKDEHKKWLTIKLID